MLWQNKLERLLLASFSGLQIRPEPTRTEEFTLPDFKVYLHISPILHLACRFTMQTIYFYALKWASLLQVL
jgi:hypothetical protein